MYHFYVYRVITLLALKSCGGIINIVIIIITVVIVFNICLYNVSGKVEDL